MRLSPHSANLNSTLLILFVLLLFAGLVYLGIWQLQRLEWKTDLIKRVETRAYAEADNIPKRSDWERISSDSHEYLRVSIRGEYMHDHQTLIWAATDLGNGYWVMTPLRTHHGEIILINRGFVPLDESGQPERIDQSNVDVEITGLIRISETDGAFLRENDPDTNRWYSRDVAAIASANALVDVAPYFIDADAQEKQEQYPLGGLTRLHFTNPHLIYALTWFSLALLLIVMVFFTLRYQFNNNPE